MGARAPSFSIISPAAIAPDAAVEVSAFATGPRTVSFSSGNASIATRWEQLSPLGGHGPDLPWHPAPQRDQHWWVRPETGDWPLGSMHAIVGEQHHPFEVTASAASSPPAIAWPGPRAVVASATPQLPGVGPGARLSLDLGEATSTSTLVWVCVDFERADGTPWSTEGFVCPGPVVVTLHGVVEGAHTVIGVTLRDAAGRTTSYGQRPTPLPPPPPKPAPRSRWQRLLGWLKFLRV